MKKEFKIVIIFAVVGETRIAEHCPDTCAAMPILLPHSRCRPHILQVLTSIRNGTEDQEAAARRR